MSSKKPPKDPRGVPCLFCDATKQYLHPNHFEGLEHLDGDANAPMTWSAYKDWVSETHGVPRDHDVFEGDTLFDPNAFWTYRDLFDR